MKKLLLLSALSVLGWALQAQDISDSTHHRYSFDGKRYQHGADSLRRHDTRDFREGRFQAMNHFHSNAGDRRFHSFHGSRFGSGGYRIHYSPEQRKQFQAINESYRNKSTNLYKNDNLTLKEYKSQLLVLQKEKKTQLQAILTSGQKDEIANRKKQARENAQVRDAAILERMRIRLQLNDGQMASIRSQRVGFRTQMQSIHENEDLLPYQKMEQIRSLASKQKDLIKSVLTVEQYSQFENMHRQRLGEK